MRIALLLLISAWCSRAEIVDRIAVTVGNQAIKQSDIMREIRLTGFVNGEKVDFSPAGQKKAASRLIDQMLIRKDIEAGHYAGPDPAEAEQLLQQVKKRYRSDAAFREALANYGITEEDLKAYFLWQTTVLKFVTIRFGIPEAGTSPAQQSAQNDINQQFFTWLDDTRKQVKPVFKEEFLK